jgi:hypothetical protein
MSSEEEGSEWGNGVLQGKKHPSEMLSGSTARGKEAAQMQEQVQGQDRASRFDAAWVKQKHLEIQGQIAKDGIEVCKWSNLIAMWSEHIRDAPYEHVELGCVKQVLQHAHLTSSSNSVGFYETLRRYLCLHVLLSLHDCKYPSMNLHTPCAG